MSVYNLSISFISQYQCCKLELLWLCFAHKWFKSKSLDMELKDTQISNLHSVLEFLALVVLECLAFTVIRIPVLFWDHPKIQSQPTQWECKKSSSIAEFPCLRNEVPPQLLKYYNIQIQAFFRPYIRGQTGFYNLYHSNTHNSSLIKPKLTQR